MIEQNGYLIAIDTGGTFTDALITTPSGDFYGGKAYTEPDSLETSFFHAVEDAAKKMGKSMSEVLSKAEQIIYGTTAGTNMIVAEISGPRLGFLTTKGFEDRIRLIRNRGLGLTKSEAMHMICAQPPKPLIERRLVKGIKERIDSKGSEFLPLEEKEVREAVGALVSDGVEGIAVGYLWSFLNNAHEVRTREIIREIAPDLMVSLSSEVAPTIREFPRFLSTIIDLHIGKALRALLEKIESRLKEEGFKRPFLVMQAIGGASQAKVVHPCTTLHSGPVGGLAGVEYLKSIYGITNAMGSDVGGTSFDVTFSPKKGEEFLREPVVGRREIATPMREIVTIGAGGGTIAWIHELTKSLRVGPQSAGSTPGPVCYGRGGTNPTITDADVVTNRIDPSYFLGGAVKLDRDAAYRAIEEKVAKPLGLNVFDAAEAIIKVVDAVMLATLKTTLAQKGYDPKHFSLFAFGGAGATHCAGYSSGLGFSEVIVAPFASVFSAFGECSADIRHRYEISPYLRIPKLPFDEVSMRFQLEKIQSIQQIPQDVRSKFNEAFASIQERARRELAEEGYQPDVVGFSYEMLARYGGQMWELRVPIEKARIDGVEDFCAVIAAFEKEYSRTYGEIAMVPRGGVEIITLALKAEVKLAKPIITRSEPDGEDPSGARKGTREVYFGGKWQKTGIYDMIGLGIGNVVNGPAIIETWNTTFVVPPAFTVRKDEYHNFVMTQV